MPALLIESGLLLGFCQSIDERGMPSWRAAGSQSSDIVKPSAKLKTKGDSALWALLQPVRLVDTPFLTTVLYMLRILVKF